MRINIPDPPDLYNDHPDAPWKLLEGPRVRTLVYYLPFEVAIEQRPDESESDVTDRVNDIIADNSIRVAKELEKAPTDVNISLSSVEAIVKFVD